MNLLIAYLKIFYEKFRIAIFIIIITLLIILTLLMTKIIIFDFPINNGENIVDYYLALSQLFGGIIGGLLTVIGVAITIFFTNNDRKHDLIMLDKPKIMAGGTIKLESKDNIIVPILNTYNELKERKVYFENEHKLIQENKSIANYKKFDIYITNNADCILEGLILGDSIIYPFDFDFILKKGNTYRIDLSNYFFTNNGKTYQNVDLIFSSLNEKHYFYTLMGNEKIIEKHEKKIIEVEIDYLAERTSGYNKIYKKVEKKLDDDFFRYLSQKIHKDR